MVGSMRWTGMVLTCLSLFALAEVAGEASASAPDGPAQEAAAKASVATENKPRPAGSDKPMPAAGERLNVETFFGQPGDARQGVG